MLEVKVVNLKRVKVDTLVVPVCEDGEIHADRTVTSLIDQAKALAAFKGKKGDVVTLFKPAEAGVNRAVFFGLGSAGTLTGESFRAFAGKAVKFCIDADLSAVTVATPSAAGLNIDARNPFRDPDGRRLPGQATSSTGINRRKIKRR